MIAENNLPSLSVIIPVFNEEKRLPACLQSLKDQCYPQDLIEILIIDDDSTDSTVDIAKNNNCKIIRNGEHNIERGKSIGLENASHEFIFFLDADNILPTKDWLKNLTEVYLANDECFGAESLYFEYKPDHSLANRYCELFGIGDPLVFYLKRQDKLMWNEDKWRLGGEIIKETSEYYIIEFDDKNLPTIGSQGFLTRKPLLKNVSWKPYLYHMDAQLELIGKNSGKARYVFMKNGVIHLYSETTSKLINKLRRNIELFHQHSSIRKYKYDMGFFKISFIAIMMITIVRPLFDSIKGFTKKRDLAWFLHPFLCFYIPFMYMYQTVKFKLGSKTGN